MSEEIISYHCSHVGVAGTTDVKVKQADGKFEARCGVAIMGSTQMDEDGFKACNYDPFHPKFYDNYAVGIGATEAEALEALKADMQSLSNLLFNV